MGHSNVKINFICPACNEQSCMFNAMPFLKENQFEIEFRICVQKRLVRNEKPQKRREEGISRHQTSLLIIERFTESTRVRLGNRYFCPVFHNQQEG